MIAKILLPVPLPQVFSYEVPQDLAGSVAFGQRVLVQFGPKKIVSGLVWELDTNHLQENLKPIISILDNHPVITLWQKELWEWMAQYYLCTLGEIMNAALPAGLKLESHTRIFVNENFSSEEALPEIQDLAWLYLQKNPGASIQDLAAAMKRKNPLPIIHALHQLGAIKLEEKVNAGYSEKTLAAIVLPDEHLEESKKEQLLESLNRAPKQKETLLAFLDSYSKNKGQPVLQKVLLEDPLCSRTALHALLKKGTLHKIMIKSSRLADYSAELKAAKELNEDQKRALQNIISSDKSVNLLHGVTSSGKTEIYIHLIQKALDKQQSVLYLLPEIALTTQMINRLRSVFGEQIGVFHSKYSDAERVEIWNDLMDPQGKINIILGARSAIFLPFRNLGLIIIDEEHETSYKQQDPAPRYHARDTAIVLANILDAQVLLGTATPSLESYFNAKSGKFGLINLTKRHKEIPLPEIIIANTKEAYRKKINKGHFTPELLEAIDQALVNKEQIILFQNRRGYSPYIECVSCNHIPTCKQCDVSLTLHKYRSRLVCHYCGYTEPVPQTCPYCHNNSLRTRGMGTEGLEDELSIIFPDARISRLDYDAARSRKGFSKIIENFEQGKTDILIGTQMVSKGLDFSNVRVVGVVNADNLLHFPDFRSFERSFQLMTQVSGRAGRSGEQGFVVIQSFDPSHRVIQQVVHNGYQEMYQCELKDRSDFAYPPFTRLIRITLKHKDQELISRAAYALANLLRKTWEHRILGPQAPGISRVQNYHLKQILIKSAKGIEHKQIRQEIEKRIQQIKADKSFRAVIIQPDVDPY